MKNGIVKRGTTYSYVLRVPDPATGKTKPVWRGGFATHAEAKAARELAAGDLQRGAYLPDQRLTVAEYLYDWLGSKDAKPKTLDGYRYNVDHYVVPRLGGTQLRDLSPMTLTRFYAELRAKGGRGGRELGWRSVDAVHRVLSSALGDAERLRLLQENPARRATLPPRPRPMTREEIDSSTFRVFSPRELRTFLAEGAGSHRMSAFFHLAAATGARRGELLHLRWRDLDLEIGEMRVSGNRGHVGGVAYDGTTKTDRPRTVDIDPATVNELRSHRGRQLEDHLRAGALWNEDEDFVFRTTIGTPVHPDHPSHLMPELCDLAGVRRLRLHELRHTHATILLTNGVPVHEVAHRLGHRDANETLRTYARVIKGRKTTLGATFAAALQQDA